MEWEDLADRPARPPDGSCIAGGPKGTLYFIDRETARVAVFDRQGNKRDIISPDYRDVEMIQDCGVSGDGSVYILFDHKDKISGINFSHVGRIKPNGSFHLIAGPHSKKNRFSLGTDLERMAVSQKGEIHLCDGDFANFRILSSDGSIVWLSAATAREDKTRAEELADALGS